MDFLDPNKKRSNKIKLYTGYVLVAVAISLAALILLFVNAGYRLDGKGNVTQNGLLFVNSRPDGADTYIEGVHGKYKAFGKTNTKFEIPEARYRVTIKKAGYRDWGREMSIDGGAVERLAYPFLFPEKLQSTDMKTYSLAPKIVSSSPDRNWIIVQHPDNILTFDIFNANEPEKPVTNFTIPQSVLSPHKVQQKLELVEWSSDNDNILFKHTYDDQVEFVIASKDQPEKSYNVNKKTNQNPLTVSLKDRKVDQLYLHMANDGLLQLVDIKTGALTPLVNKALAYKTHGDDMLVYVAPIADSNLVSVRIKNKDKDYELRQLPVSTGYVVDVARFDNAWYVVAGAASGDRVFVYKDPLSVLASSSPKKSIFARTLRIKNPQKASFSANARMIAVQSGQSFAVYDAENDRQYKYTINDTFDTNRPVEWMDGHRLVSSTGGSVLVFDFDGINQQKLMAIDSSTDVMFDRDYDNAFSLSPNKDNKSILVKTKLLVTN